MFNNEYALVYLLSLVPMIEGRKKLQKMVYLLQRLGAPYKERFSYHYYGPYSSELQAEIDKLADFVFLKESYDGSCYTYEITNEGRIFLKNYKNVFGIPFELSKDIVTQLADTKTYILELASTYSYLLEIGYEDSKATQRAIELKPHLKSYISDAKKLLNDIKIKLMN